MSRAPRGPVATAELADAVGKVLGQRAFRDRAHELALEVERLPAVDARVEALDALSA